ncbi:MAG TPA: hypothetical protein VES42_15365 [Pilimelia sp.]|nr:hypothetical protein [Pilimelia sp.]
MGRPSRVLSTAAALVLAGGCLIAGQGPAAALPSGGTRADFNGDGYADLAIGAPYDDVGAVEGAGAVNVLYGSAAGLAAARNQLWHQNSAGIANVAEAGDTFGASLSPGDFNGDGYADLAIGAPWEDVEGATPLSTTGVAHVLYGGPAGLSAAGNQMFDQSAGDTPEEQDRFGETLAAGDFDGDGRDDLAIGAPTESVGAASGTGAVLVLPGGAAGLTTAGAGFHYQGETRAGGAAETNDRFGHALATGDFNGDETTDLLVGVSGETLGSVWHTGAAHVLYGGPDGVGSAGVQVWNQNTAGVLGTPEANDDFGDTVASGDFNGDGYADAAIAATGESVGTASSAGAVHVIFGGPSGLQAAGNQLWDRGDAGEPVSSSEQFGTTLAVGDFDVDDISDLVVGLPYQSVEGIGGFVGVAHLILGSPAGPTAVGTQLLRQGTAGLPETAEAYDTFASALAADDYNGDGHADLAVGASGEAVGAVPDAGVTHVINGYAGGLATSGSQLWHQNSPGIAGSAALGDSFGTTLSEAG